MSSDQACSDCYQINLSVCLPEETVCLLKHNGSSAFEIKNNAHNSKCSSCMGGSCSAPSSDGLTPLTITASIPEATILNARLVDCDSANATFSLFVKLPCDGVDVLNIDMVELNRLFDKLEVLVTGINPPVVGMLNDFNQTRLVLNQLGDAITAGNCVAAKEAIATLTELPIDALDQMYHSLPEIDSTTADAIVEILKRERTLLEPRVANNFNAFVEQEFTISANGCEVVTFSVKSLVSNVVTTGIVHDDYSYEITRVPNRSFVTAEGNPALAVCCDGKTTVPIATECCRICVGNNAPVLAPDTLRITVPLTHQLKCLMPDYNILNAYYNSMLGNGPTKVRLVSKCPVKFAIPAIMTFDKKRCTATIEISHADLLTTSMVDYEHMFGSLGCMSVNNSFNPNCAFDSAGVNLVNAMKTNPEKMFQILAMARRLEITGLHKCVETVFFAFRLCPVPYEPFCVSVCGCKLRTIVDPNSGATVMNAYTIQSDSDVYEFSFLKMSDSTEGTTIESTTAETTTLT